jgi:hypothetical protein
MAALPLGIAAQQPRRVSGVIERTTEDSTLPMRNAWVVLHRVGRGSAGPVDSMRSDAKGRYAFQYRSTQDSAVYFASTKHSGVAYFTAPFMGDEVSGDAATIVVFDTSSTGPRPASRSRHIVVFASADGQSHRVSEVFWLENTSAVTRVASERGPSWTVSIPAAAGSARVDGGNVPVDGVRFGNGIVEVYAPLSPGLHQLHVSYDVQAKSFPLRVGLRDTTSVVEVLIEGARGTIRGKGLEVQEPVTAEGRSFRRFLGHDLAAGQSFEVVVPRAGGVSGRTLYIMAVFAAAGMALLFGLTRRQAGRRPLPGVAKDTPPEAAQLASAIADLDEQFAKQKDAGEEERAAYSAQRAALNAQLASVLEARDDQL